MSDLPILTSSIPTRNFAGDPRGYGYAAWTYDKGGSSSTQILTAQAVWAVRVPVPAPFTCTKVDFITTTKGTSNTYARLAIFDAAGTSQLWLSGSITTEMTATEGNKSIAVSPSLVISTDVWVAVLCDGGTQPTLARAGANSGAYVTAINTPVTRFLALAGQASMPSSLSGASNSNQQIWFGLRDD